MIRVMINYLTDPIIATTVTSALSICGIISYIFSEKVRNFIKCIVPLSKYILYLLPHFLFTAYDVFKKKHHPYDNNKNKEILLKIEQSVKAMYGGRSEVTNRTIFDELGFGNKLSHYCEYGIVDESILVINNKDLDGIKKIYEIK